MAKPILIETSAGPMSLRALAHRHGLSQATVYHRWLSGDRTAERLARPATELNNPFRRRRREAA